MTIEHAKNPALRGVSTSVLTDLLKPHSIADDVDKVPPVVLAFIAHLHPDSPFHHLAYARECTAFRQTMPGQAGKSVTMGNIFAFAEDISRGAIHAARALHGQRPKMKLNHFRVALPGEAQEGVVRLSGAAASLEARPRDLGKQLHGEPPEYTLILHPTLICQHAVRQQEGGAERNLTSDRLPGMRFDPQEYARLIGAEAVHRLFQLERGFHKNPVASVRAFAGRMLGRESPSAQERLDRELAARLKETADALKLGEGHRKQAMEVNASHQKRTPVHSR